MVWHRKERVSKEPDGTKMYTVCTDEIDGPNGRTW